MIVPQRIKSKVNAGQVLNLSELAHASGYDRNVLAKMFLPLIAGKISLQDFQRIMRKRQDKSERTARFQIVEDNGDGPPSGRGSRIVRIRRRVSNAGSTSAPVPANNGQKLAAAGMFYGRSSKRANKAASRPLDSTPLRNSA